MTHTNRNEAYQERMAQAWSQDKPDYALYVGAHLALDELMQRTQLGISPDDTDFEAVYARFELAGDKARQHNNPTQELRARLTGAYIKPMVWADILNIDGLHDSEARTAYESVGLRDAQEESYAIADEALRLYDELIHITATRKQTPEEYGQQANIIGFLSEITPDLLFARHATAKRFNLPVTDYEDDLRPNPRLHIDRRLYDNRLHRERGVYGYQVKTGKVSRSYNVPVIYARDMGNDPKSSYWPTRDKPFTTLRMLGREKRGELRSPKLVSTLDRIQNDVFKKITTEVVCNPTWEALALGKRAVIEARLDEQQVS